MFYRDVLQVKIYCVFCERSQESFEARAGVAAVLGGVWEGLLILRRIKKKRYRWAPVRVCHKETIVGLCAEAQWIGFYSLKTGGRFGSSDRVGMQMAVVSSTLRNWLEFGEILWIGTCCGRSTILSGNLIITNMALPARVQDVDVRDSVYIIWA